MAGKGKSAKSVAARLLAAVIFIAAGAAVFAGRSYGLFDRFDSDIPSVPAGFIDETATRAFVEFIEVNEGESVLIGSDGHFMLIDAGRKIDSEKVMKILEIEGVEQLDFIVLSNPGTEHIGGAAEILWRVRTKCLILPKIPDAFLTGNTEYGSLLEAAGVMGADIRTAGDECFTLGGSKFDTYIPYKSYEEPGDYSVYVRFCHGDNSFLFTGDSSKLEEEELVGRGIKLSSDVLKASNHAGRDSCGSSLLTSVSPKYTVISCGRDDSRGNPNRDTLRRIGKFSPHILMTSEYGTIRFESDGSRISVAARYEHPADSSLVSEEAKENIELKIDDIEDSQDHEPETDDQYDQEDEEDQEYQGYQP